jgi:UTP--glucose-1-phosphate uridylyltransferase
MMPVVDKPLIQYAVEEAVAAGIEQVIFVTGRGKRSIEDHFDHQDGLEALLLERGKEDLARVYREVSDMAEVTYVRQKQPLGLGHAVWCARHAVGNEPFAVLLPDDLMDSDPGAIASMKAAFDRLGGSHLAVEPVDREATGAYGVIDAGDPLADGAIPVRGLVEKPSPEVAPSNQAVVGRYILPAAVFEPLGRAQRGAGGEIQLTDALQALVEGGEPLYAHPFEGVRFDCGSKAGYLKAQLEMGLRREELGAELADYLHRRLAEPAPDRS